MYNELIIGILEALITERNKNQKEENLVDTYKQLQKELNLKFTEEINKQIYEDFVNANTN